MTITEPSATFKERLIFAAQHWEEGEGATLAREALRRIAVLEETLAAAERQRTEAQTALTEKMTALTELSRQEVLLRTNFTAFKLRVRTAAHSTQKGHSNHIAVAELNDWLRSLGLDPVVTKFRVTPEVFGENLSSVVVEADDEDSAAERVREFLADHATAEVSATFTLNYPDRDGFYWPDSNKLQMDLDEPETPDWQSELTFSVEEVSE